MGAEAKVNLFIIGAAKCGTTSLFRYMEQMPVFHTTEPKEPRYFATDIPDTHRPIKTLEAYHKLYLQASPDAVYRIDASPAYMYSRDAAQKIHQYNPHARIIVMLRPPCQAVYSVHAQYLWQCDEDVADFNTAWNLSDARIKGLSLPRHCSNPLVVCYKEFARFGRQLEPYYQHFRPEQIHLILLEEMQLDVQGQFQNVLNFLELDSDISSVDFSVRNANAYHRSGFLMRLTKGKFAGYGLIRGLAKRFGIARPTRLMHTLQSINTREQKRPPLDVKLQDEIIQHYSDDVCKIEQLTGRDLSHWRKLPRGE